MRLLDHKRLEAIFHFLPYDPNILILNPHRDNVKACRRIWPYAHIFSPDSPFINHEGKIDFIWLESNETSLLILQTLSEILSDVKVLFITSLSKLSKLKPFLEEKGLILFSDWDWEGKYGNAIFLKKEILDSLLRSLHYSSNDPISCSEYLFPSKIERFLRPIERKTNAHSIPNIDFIYMINLDERPEKFALASTDLAKFDIHPYRFSAINGWKLTTGSINELGMRHREASDSFFGSVYKEINGQEYISNELIADEGTSYFSLGMSRGAIGCLLSHLSILQDAYDAEYKTIWILEDDIEVLEDPWQIPKLIDNLDSLVNDWDIFFTDIDFKGKDGNYVPCRTLAARPNFSMQPLSFYLGRFYPLSRDFFSIGMRYGTYSMIIRRSGIEKILKYYKSFSLFLPYDLDYWLIPELKMYASSKDIVSSYPGSISDNELTELSF
ncbi:MAG TPA: glycosyltransferase family 25 protein [Rhabdochlamydiaceae bacterium]|nr:glycosyltransferase family 25 protein [Rhabdochlamydiaceae bacterium]